MGDLTIHEHEPLGKGCYGEVYKGTITGRRQRSGSRKGPRSPRFSLTNTVAVKRLQSKCLGITSLYCCLASSPDSEWLVYITTGEVVEFQVTKCEGKCNHENAGNFALSCTLSLSPEISLF